jgi:hypothetical protein
MHPKERPTLVEASRREKTTTSDEGANCNWLMEAWRRAGYTPLNKSAIDAKVSALGLRTPAVMIAPRLASKSGVLSPSPSLSPSSSSSLSQPTPRNTASHSASAWKTKAASLAVKSAAVAVSLFSPSSAIDAALRVHHSRKFFENPYVTW